jgi:O-antigen ligase
MPFMRDILRSSTVAGPSVFFLGFVFVVGFIPYLLKGGRIPKTILPLIGFLIACLFSISVSQFIEMPTFKETSNIRSMVTALMTLFVGIGFFLVTYSQITGKGTFDSTLRWIYAGGVLLILWSLIQSGTWFFIGHYADWMRDFQDLISLGPLYRQRATGFALEPSWLAHMLNLLYLPVWLAAVCSGYSISRFRILKVISVELILLVFGGLVLLLTFSRVGWMTFAAMSAFLLILGNIQLVRKIRSKISETKGKAAVSTFAISIGLLIIYFILVVLAAFFMSRIDPRMEDLFKPQFWELNNFNRYANALQFGERVVYWQAGWEIFNQYPLSGVGLGNAGKWFSETVPPYGINLIEVRRLLFRSMELPNIKNLWIRILTETGIIGFSFFVGWLAALFRRARDLFLLNEPVYKMLGYLGFFSIIGILLEGFSIDSFAMPYFWITSGLVLSGGKVLQK